MGTKGDGQDSASIMPGEGRAESWFGSFATTVGAGAIGLSAILVLIAVEIARSGARPVPMLWVVFVLILALAAIVAALLARAIRRGRAAEQESRRRTALLEAEVAAHTATSAELARARAAAEAANEAKSRYLVAVSHEIRSPLNAIYGYAQLLERDEAISGAEAGRVIRRSAEHVTNLVEGLLEISRIESGVVSLRNDVVDLHTLLHGVVDMFRTQAAAKGLALDLDLSPLLPRFTRTDERRLRQMLINMLSNAIKYTETGGATIAVAYRSQVAEIEVRDTGPGIVPEDVERIFQPFERGSAPAAQLQPGIGLGLAITRALALIMGGDIDVRSAPGRGSSFRLRLMLPRLVGPPVDASAGGGRIRGYEGGRRTILVIDDDAAQIAVMQKLLEPLGFTVHAAASGAEGIALAAKQPVDLVLVDIQMPGLTGWETAERLRAAHGRALPIVMVSANAHEFRAGSDGESAHDAFVTKPVAFDALLGVIGAQFGLTWRHDAAADAAAPPPVPSEAKPSGEVAPYLATLRTCAQVGDIRGIERGLNALAETSPGASTLVGTLRRHAEAFDLRSFLRVLDAADG